MKIFTNNKFLTVYIIIVIFVLVYIVFLAPDSFIKEHSRFRSFYQNGELIPSGDDTDVIVPVAYEEQIKQLKNKHYSYEYLIDYNNVMYKCKGNKDGEYDQGRCTKPTEVEYTTQTLKDVYKDIEIDLLDVDHIFDMVKDIEYTKSNMGELDVYKYEIPAKKDGIEVTVYSDHTAITEILITRRYYAYQLKFNNIN